MSLLLTNYKTTLPPALLRKAEKCTVRECDETNKGTYEAYVDEGSGSYDVMLRLDKGKEVAEHRCDCGSTESFCRHKAALLLTLAGKIAAKTPLVKGKKQKPDKIQELLEAADAEALKAWVKELLQKNKDLSLAFEQYFGEKKTVYTKAEAEALTAQAVKSVVKNRTRIEQSELKKIVELWGEVHKPVVDAYLANVAAEDGFEAFHAVLEACLQFALKLQATGVKIPNYIQSLLDKAVEPIAKLFSDEAFETATGFYFQHIVSGDKGVRLHYLTHLQKILSVSTTERREAGMKKLVQQYKSLHHDQLFNGAEYTKSLFAFAEANGFLSRYLSAFKPIRYDNNFNIVLIEKLIESGTTDLAEKYALAQMAVNFREEYDLPYLELLKKIYQLQQNQEALAAVLEKLLPYTFHFDDYLFLYNRMPDGEEKKKWRTKLVNKAKNASSIRRGSAEAFYFSLLNHEKGYKKMIGAIDSRTPYGLILNYYGPMAAADKQALLKAIIEKGDDYGWSYLSEKEVNKAQYFPALTEAMIKTYGIQTLMAAVLQAESKRFYYRDSEFISYLKKSLAAT